jgi:hypothetical protein
MEASTGIERAHPRDRHRLEGRLPAVGELTDRVRSFLDERRYAVLATHDPDGGIRLTPI